MGFDFQSVVGKEKAKVHDRRRDTGTKVLETQHASIVGAKEQVTLLETEVDLGTRVQERLHAGMEMVRALDRMRGTALGVQARLPWADTA